MGNRNSLREDFVLDLFKELFADLIAHYPTESKNFARDYTVVKQRLACEGLSFVTKTLPKLGKAIDAALDEQRFIIPTEFQTSHENKTIPAFLQGLFKRIFARDGSLLDDAAPSVVNHLRQVLYLVYKLEVPYARRTEQAVITAFRANEQKVISTCDNIDVDLLRRSKRLLGIALSGFDPKEIVPKHGPGSVATGEKSEEKWEFSRLYDKIHQVFPYYDYFVAGRGREILDRVAWYRNLSKRFIAFAKVVLVPKDSRGPRLISCEPLEYMWIQQGIGRSLVRHIESHSFTKGFVNFTDQSVNQWLATSGSYNRRNATIDLKDASDLVSLVLVQKLFPKEIVKCFEAARSDGTVLPDGSEMLLKKFAPMGSALCFPVEALVFWALSVAAISQAGLPLRHAATLVYVYGDDIVVPTKYFSEVVAALTSAGLAVNREKCCYRGFFRESCGVDAFKGVDVTPTRIRTLWSGKPSDGNALVSYASYANSLCKKGFARASEYLFRELERCYGLLPYATATSGIPCREVESSFGALILNLKSGNFKIGFDPVHQRTRLRAKVLRGKTTVSTLSGWPRLLRNMVSGLTERPDEVALARSAQIVTRWVTVY
jgi:hypothetical protein